MKINDLKDSFDAISPTAEQKERMLTEILNAEEYAMPKVFNFKKALASVAAVAAVAVICVSVYNYGGFNVTENYTSVVQNIEEEKTEEIIKEEPLKESKAEEKAPVKKEKKKKTKENIQVASAEPVNENVVAEIPVPMSMARTIDGPAAMIEDENTDASTNAETGENNQGIAVISEKDTNNNVEWITVPSLEDVEGLEEENIDAEEDEEETEEDSEEETEEVSE